MPDQSGLMTLARLNLLQTRMSGLILGALVEQRILPPRAAGALVRDVIGFLDDEQFDARIVEQMRDAYEQIATQLEQHRPEARPR